MDSYHTHTIPDAGTGDYTSSVYLLVYISVLEHIIMPKGDLASHPWNPIIYGT